MQLQATTNQRDVSQLRNHSEENYDGDGTTLHLPTSTQPETSWYHGAMVGVEESGINNHVVYPDLHSMYPSIMLTLNIGPDTIVGTAEDLRESEYDESDCVNGFIDTRPVKRCEDGEDYSDYTDGEYKAVLKDGDKKWSDDPEYTKCYYLRPDVKEGFVTQLIDDFMVRKKESKGTELYAATKAVLNSIYGVFGWATDTNSFRLFDHRVAETVTLTGRKVLQQTMDSVVEYSQNERDTDAYVTHFDTDGAGVSLDVSGQQEALSVAEDAVDYLESGQNSRVAAGSSSIADRNDGSFGSESTGYPQFLRDECGYPDELVDEHHLSADIEYYASSIYNHDAKKRYALRCEWDEGEDVDEIDITGFECIRSDVANVTVDVQERVFDLILRNNLDDVKDEVYDYISDTITAVEDGDVPVEDLGVRNGIGQELEEYGSANRRPQPIYRGALWARDNVPGEDGLGEASKPMKFPVKHIIDDSVPHRYQRGAQEGDVVDTVAVEDPRNIEDMVVVDREIVSQKQVIDRVKPIIDNIDEYSWTELQEGHTSSALSDFM